MRLSLRPSSARTRSRPSIAPTAFGVRSDARKSAAASLYFPAASRSSARKKALESPEPPFPPPLPPPPPPPCAAAETAATSETNAILRTLTIDSFEVLENRATFIGAQAAQLVPLRLAESQRALAVRIGVARRVDLCPRRRAGFAAL